MAILRPSQIIAQQWDGALAASLRRAPLEGFLRTRALKVAPRGAARDSDNICRAALFLLRGPLLTVSDSLSEAQSRLIGQVCCSVCDRLARLIDQPQSWRVAALVSTAQLLPRKLGLLASANFAADTTREYHGSGASPHHEIARLGVMAAEAVAANSDALVRDMIAQMVTLLAKADEIASIDDSRCAGERRSLMLERRLRSPI